MKARIAMALSLVGVLSAGSAAALVNTQILDGGATESGASKAVLPPASTIELTVPAAKTAAVEVRRADADAAESASTTTTTSPSSTTSTTMAAPVASGMLTSFDVGAAGVVTVDVVDGRLVLVSAEPKPDWLVTKAEDDSNDDSDEFENEVEVEFRSATIEVEFEATLVDGQIVPKVESSLIGGAGAASTTIAGQTGPTTTIDDDDDEYDDSDDRDDDDDDEYDDSEYDDSDDRDDDSEDDEDDEDDDRDDD